MKMYSLVSVSKISIKGTIVIGVLLAFAKSVYTVSGFYYKAVPFCSRTTQLSENVAYRSEDGRSIFTCFILCSNDVNCAAVKFNSTHSCSLYNASSANCDADSSVSLPKDTIHMQKIRPALDCKNGGYNTDTGCQCVSGYVGDTCDRLMTDCSDGFYSGSYSGVDGVYQIQPFTGAESFEVFCRMKDGGYTILQANIASSPLSFNRSWQEFKVGFGVPGGSYWLGLERMHEMTLAYNYDAFVYVVDDIASTPYMRRYTNFLVDAEYVDYYLHFENSSSVAGYNDLGDSMFNLKGMSFSTYDRDLDSDMGIHCAERLNAGFWYDACAFCNPNGKVGVPSSEDETAASWLYDLGSFAIIKRIEIGLVRL